MRARLEIDCKNPKVVADSVMPEAAQLKKFSASLRAEKGRLVLEMESDSPSGLLAGLSSYIRLVRAALHAAEI